MSQAPGLRGTPDSGHCSRAARRASCASSSATPTSRTIRVRPAMSLGDSILQTASIARCVSVAVTATDHTIFKAPVQPSRLFRFLRGDLCAQTLLLCSELWCELGTELVRLEHLANL